MLKDGKSIREPSNKDCCGLINYIGSALNSWSKFSGTSTVTGILMAEISPSRAQIANDFIYKLIL